MEIVNFKEISATTALEPIEIESVSGGVIPVVLVALYFTAFSTGVAAGWTFGSAIRPINVR